MSERLSSVEIEDVLSSIRRLVSEDLRPSARADAAASAAASGASGASGAAEPVAAESVAAESAAGEKLILTPALRIAPEGDAPSPGAGSEGAEGGEVAAVPSFQSVRQGRGATVVDRVTRALPDEEWEPVAEAAAPTRSDWATEAEAAMEAAGSNWSEAPVAPVEQPADPVIADDGDVAEAAERWPASDLPEANWSAPGEQAPMEPDQPDESGWSAVEPMEIDRPTPDVLQGAGRTEAVAASLADPHVVVDEGVALTEAEPSDLPDWARMETEVEDPAEEDPVRPEPAVSGPSATARQDAGWADAAEAEIRRELEDEATATVFARFEDDDHDDRHFDEDMLRDLVRDIIREELQGALGERITRNVRKLVRAEIARALAVRDFE